MTWLIEYKAAAIKSLAKINPQDRATIREFLTVTLPKMSNPRSKGEPLHGVLRDYWKYRLGNFRVIVEIKDKIITIVVAEIGDRKAIYQVDPNKLKRG